MTRKAKIIITIASAVAALAVAIGLCIYLIGRSTPDPQEPKTITLVENGATDYTVIFSTDKIKGDFTMANSIKANLLTLYGADIRVAADTEITATELEILLGITNRPESAELKAMIDAACVSEGDYVWGYAVINGKLLYMANCEEAYAKGADEFLAFLTESAYIVSSELSVVKNYTEEERLTAERLERIETLTAMNQGFTDSQFNTDLYKAGQFYRPMVSSSGDGYLTKSPSGSPTLYPEENQHPRFLVTDSTVERMKEMLNDGNDSDSEYYTLITEYLKRAETDIEDIYYGVFQDKYKNTSSAGWLEPTGEPYRYDDKVIAVIEAKALAYLLTKDEVFALEAIVAIKNAILSLRYTADLHYDTYHGASHLMITVAAVYDWCYDAMSEEDKWQIIWGTAQILGPQMESGMQYPPTGMSAVNGHGIGPQLLRDWLSVASVFYDEAPDWWELVAGRYFNEYAPVANEIYGSGWVPSGTSNYAPLHLYNQAWAAYVVYTSCGENPLGAGVRQSAYYLISHITPRSNGNSYEMYYFETGDGSRSPGGKKVGYSEYFILAALYNDPVIYAQARDVSRDHLLCSEGINETTTLTMTHALQLCFSSAVDYKGENVRENLSKIQYFSDYASQMTARESWTDADSIAVLMRIVNKTTANHQCYSHGTFQIYYKGLLATTSGRYAKYGSSAHYYYQQATISENGLLIFNPKLASSDPKDTESYYYSGGQKRKTPSGASLDAWLTSSDMAKTLGAAYGYNSDGSPKYAYLAGDLTDAYDAVTVDFVGRSMFTLFTGNEDFPLLFFTFDRMASDEESFTKHWLLHTIKEPTIDQDTLSATIINGDAKMYLRSLYGADSIVKIGGDGKAWWINGYFTDPTDKGSWDEKLQDFTDPDKKGSWVEGKNATDAYAKNDDAANIWGRIELRAEGERTTEMLTVLAVTDAALSAAFNIEKFSSPDSSYYGARFEDTAIIFLNPADPTEKRFEEFSFTVPGNGSTEYYIAGVEEGTWEIFVNGVSITTAKVTEEGALLNFTAPSGELTIKPKREAVITGKISYEAFGGLIPKDAPKYYDNSEELILPTDVKRNDDTFVGWYTSADLSDESRITSIKAGTTGNVKVYAKWICNFLDEDYSDSAFNVIAGVGGKDGVDYNGGGKVGSSFITKYDEKNKRSYLEWIEGEMDPLICQKSTSRNFTALGSAEKCVSFTVQLSANPDYTPMATEFRTVIKEDMDGYSLSPSAKLIFFSTDTDGYVYSHSKAPLFRLSEEITTVRLVVDFKNGEIRYHGEDYSIIASDVLTIPSATGATSAEELRGLLNEYLWYFYAASDVDNAALRIYKIRCQDGDEFAPFVKPVTNKIKYNTNGALLPVSAPTLYNTDGTPTPLPTAQEMLREGFTFLGWYTTATFDESTLTTEVPPSYEGEYEVYAKWKSDPIAYYEDFSGADFDYSNTSKSYNDYTFNAYKSGARFQAVTEGGVSYLLWTGGSADPIMLLTNDTKNIAAMTESSVSYTLCLAKNGADDLADIEFRVIGKRTASGESTSTTTGNIYLGQLIGGEFKLGTSGTSVATVTTEVTTVRLVIDFKLGTLSAYSESGEVIATDPLPAIPQESGATTHLEWQSCFGSYLFYARRINGSEAGAQQKIRIHSIRIEEGNTHRGAANP